VATDAMKEFKQTFASTMRHIMFLAMPASMLLLILRIPLVRIAYGSSEFPWSATLLTGKAVAILSLALFAQGGIHLLVRAFYALHNTLLPFIVALIAVCVNISLSYLGVFVYSTGVLGLATALAASTFVHFVLLLILISRYIPGLFFKELFLPIFRIVLASGIMAVFLWIPMRLLDQFVFDTTRTIPLILLTLTASVIGGGMYLLLARSLKISEYLAYVKLIKKMGRLHTLLGPSEEIIDTPTQTQEIKPI
jgi:putative peptidoglycan lipid II flippase